MTALLQTRLARFFAALLPPLAAALLQWLAWPLTAPYPWLLFSPAIFLSAWLGGLAGGMAATALSIVLIQLVFIDQFLSVTAEVPHALAGSVILIASGVLF